MVLINLKVRGFKNLSGPEGWFDIDFTNKDGITVLVGNNGSGKSNVLEAISAIFASHFDSNIKADFSYEITYAIRNQVVKIMQTFQSEGTIGIQMTDSAERPETMRISNAHMRNYEITGEGESDIINLLPYNVIAVYSGEETRLYRNYYKHFYEKFIDDGIRNRPIDPRMVFLSSEHWSVVLLTLLASDYDLSKILGIKNVDRIIFKCNNENIRRYLELSPTSIVNIFADSLSSVSDLTLESFKDICTETHENLYRLLAISLLHKNETARLISSLNIIFNDGTDLGSLSEGEKKQLLMFFIFELLSGVDSLILLDEPDSYIHVGNKLRLKEMFEKFRDQYVGGEILCTTHSPTLMHSFTDEQIVYLEKGEIQGKEKREILSKLTAGLMSSVEKEIILTSKKKLLLLTEGKTDAEHILLAKEKLGIDLDFDIYPCGNAGKVTEFLMGMPADLFDGDKTIVGIYDYDNEGLKQIRRLGQQITENKMYKLRLEPTSAANAYGITLPTSNELELHENCPVEFLYSVDKLHELNMITKKSLGDANFKLIDAQKLNQRELDSAQELCYFRISESDTTKHIFCEACKSFDAVEFEGFRPLFEHIASTLTYSSVEMGIGSI